MAYESMGSYIGMLMVSIVLMLASAAITVLLPKYP